MFVFILSCLCIILLVIITLFRYLLKVCFTPFYIQNFMRSQGIKGPSYKFPHGNTKEMVNMRIEAATTPMDHLSHHIYPRILPEVYTWIKLYGKNFLCWRDSVPILVVTDPEMIKEALGNKDGTYERPETEGIATKFLKEGVALARGEKWYKLRKISNHAFNGERLKGMVPTMITSVEEMLGRWREQEDGNEIEIYQEFKILTSEVILRTAFGSSYLEGKVIFDKLTEFLLFLTMCSTKFRFPGAGIFFKTADDIESDKLAEAIREPLMKIIESREEKSVEGGEAESFGSDFLGLLIQASHETDNSKKISVDDLIDECKTFYINGQETTNALLAWVMLLLATHLDWQEKARDEVLELFGHETPNSEGISRIKIMNMIINETLRLYSPTTLMPRQVERKTRLGNLTVPANVELMVPIPAIHHDNEIWGRDAHLFKPERFAEGVAKATKGNPIAFIPFGYGPRNCLGMNFASIEAKIALSMILQRYKFTLSPNYVHSPTLFVTIQPQNGLQIMLQTL